MKKYVNRYLLIFVIFIAILTVWYGLNNRELQNPENPVLPETKISTLPQELEVTITDMARRAGEIKSDTDSGLFNLLKRNEISVDTPLILQTYYEKSDELIEYVTTMPDSFTGLTIEQLKSTIRDWDIREYQPKNALVLHRSKNELTPEDKNNQHLGIENGRVVIFYGKKGKTGNKVIKQKTSIKEEDLPQSERAKLNDGIEIKSEEELFTILEGLLSYKQD